MGRTETRDIDRGTAVSGRADLAGLNLDDDGDSSEAVWLAAEAVRVLRAVPTERSKATASWGLDRDGPERWSV